ncbi:CCCH zinc finger domain-containing protein [Dioscorea alata]|uniref:CCCH zinc finger domain-containing protein n=1 Tax=Dioscorea alata TaxID=55571 RepID=A0ACB7V517_DIOAL|nr:CCCH zinc finger domain-containing protein [Dioscorea alata]
MNNKDNDGNKKNSQMPMYFRLKMNSGNTMVTVGHELDEFLMYDYKIQQCSRSRSHDWISCPFTHKDEKAKRRDPRKVPYAGIACPDFKLHNQCPRGQNCQYAHGVFELWLHPSRYRTRLCEDGVLCLRRICFFAHSKKQLRPVVYNDECFLHHHPNNSFKGLDGNVPTSSSAAPVMRPRMMVEAPRVTTTSTTTTAALAIGSINALQNKYVASASMEEEELDLPDISWVIDLVG